MTFDLSTLDTKAPAEAGTVVELENPFAPTEPFVDDAGVPYSITILGGDAGKVRAKSRKQVDVFLKRLRQNQEPTDMEQELAERLAAATIAWHLPDLDGEPMPVANEHNARRLYLDARFPWIVEQLNKRLVDRSRFFPTRSANSSSTSDTTGA